MASQYFDGLFSHLTANASITDTTPPTFAGITTLTAEPNGALSAGWDVATDGTPPLEYSVYITVGSVAAVTLFSASNLVAITPALSYKIFTTADQNYLEAAEYTVGVRAKDAVGNINQNTAVLVTTASGVLSDSLAASVLQLNIDTTKIENAAALVLSVV
jgi:hypothetical protein